MGQMTRGQIVLEGQLLAQRSDAATLATGWLQRWLDSVAASWPWPMLQREAIDLAATGPSLVLGNGSGGISTKVLKFLDNFWLYDSTRSTMQRLRLMTQLNKPQDRLPPGGGTGTPNYVRIFQSSFGQWTLYFHPNPDRPYLLSAAYLELPAQLGADLATPWYPNDETMVQAVAFKCHEYFDGKDDPKTLQAQQLLSAAIANDRIRYGSVNGINDVLQLDPVRFTRAKAP